jgi:small subunit ribosomal protein S4e
MTKAHLKRLATPRSWPIKRKGITFIARPASGKPLELTIPLVVAARDMIKVCKTAKELSYMMHEKGVIVDGKIRKSKNYPVGLFDVITFVKSKKSYRMTLSVKGKISFVESTKDSDLKLVNIKNKTNVKGKTQLNFHTGTNMLVEKDTFKVGDSIVLDKDAKIKETLAFEKGAAALLIAGKHIGAIGNIEEIKDGIITFKQGDEVFETRKKYALVVGKKKPSVQLA